MTDALIVFVNGATVKLPSGATVLDAVAAHDAAAAAEVRAGTRAVADSRGIVVDPASTLTGGFVMRLVSARQLADGA
jgi:hypothetical protein